MDAMSLLSMTVEYAIAHRWELTGYILAISSLGYILYMRFMHPLARYPGPFLASLTNLWKAYEMYHGQMEYVIRELHDKHGAIVRIGPNDLVISHPDAVKQIYLSGSAFQKVQTPFCKDIDVRPNSITGSLHFDRTYSELKMNQFIPFVADNCPIAFHRSQF